MTDSTSLALFLLGAALGLVVGGLLGARWAFGFLVSRTASIMVNDPSLHTVQGAADALGRVRHALIGHGLSTEQLLRSIVLWEEDLVEQAKEIGARMGSAVRDKEETP